MQLSIITAVFVFMMAVVLTTLVAEDEYAIARWPQAKMRPAEDFFEGLSREVKRENEHIIRIELEFCIILLLCILVIF